MTAAGKFAVPGIAATIGLAVYAVGFAGRAGRGPQAGPTPLKAETADADTQTRRHADTATASDLPESAGGRVSASVDNVPNAAASSRPHAESSIPSAALPPPADGPDAEFGLVADNGGVRPTQIANSDQAVLKALKAADDALAGGKYLEAWESYNAVVKMGLASADSRIVKARINTVTDTLLFGSFRPAGDDNFPVHTVRVGERLGIIGPKYGMPWEAVVRMNNGLDPARVAAGRTLKLVRGPLHLVVIKSEYELDVMLDGKVLRAYAVGLGENNCTPAGKFTVSNKMKNPPYTHPRTNARFAGGDPKNPVGTRWMALEGADEASRKFTGYAIHGTIEPESICRQASLGCVRMLKDDVEELYDLVTMGGTTVEIRE
jgi:LysM repeat protein